MSPGGGTTSWIADVRAHGVAAVGIALGLEYDERRHALSPCPGCAAKQRHENRHDRRGALGVRLDDMGFECFGVCKTTGDAVTLVALLEVGAKLTKGDLRWRDVQARAAAAGLCDPPRGMRVAAARRRQPMQIVVPKPPERLPHDELTAFWGAAAPVDKDEVVSAFLVRRGLDPAQVAAADLARALPLDVAAFPVWWPASRAKVWRLAVLAYDSQGVPRNLQARAVVDLGEGPRQLWPKHPEKTYSASNLFFADAAGMQLLRGESIPGLSTVLITEGLTDMLAASLWCSRTRRAQAVLSVFSGAARALREVRWPPGITVYVATDPDDTGDKYAAEVRAAVPAELRVRRVNLRTLRKGSDVMASNEKDFASATDEEREAAWDEATEMPPPPRPGGPDGGASGGEGPSAEETPFAVPRTYTFDDLAKDRSRVLVSLADLPDGHGLGERLDQLLGGGARAGDFLAFGAPMAGGGKTALLMQTADGLALRSAVLADDADAGGPLTPVVMLSEMPSDTLAHRTLARLCRVPASIFRSGLAAERFADWNRKKVDDAYAAARAHLADGGAFARMRAWEWIARPKEFGGALVERLAEFISDIVKDLKRKYPSRDVWPVVVIDPIQRWQGADVGEVEALNELVEDVDQRADEEGWIVLASSDTNKSSAVAGADDADAVGIFRGTYKFFHAADAVLALRPATSEPGKQTRVVTVEIAKNRNGPSSGTVSLEWDPACGLFVPVADGAPGARRPAASNEPSPTSFWYGAK